MSRLKTAARRAANRATTLFMTPFVVHRCGAANIYHCCAHKSASQWIRRILSDRRVFRYSGLRPYSYEDHLSGGLDTRRLTERSIDAPMPLGTIVTPLYLAYPCFAAMPKPETHRAFWVTRDPRDLVVSWYFSMRYSHAKMRGVYTHRARLEEMSLHQGLVYCIERQGQFGLFEALDSWIGAAEHDHSVRVVRYEDLTGPDQQQEFASLFEHLDIRMPDATLARLLAAHSFMRLTRGRHQGQEDKHSHYRKGKAGDWRNYFTDETSVAFAGVAADLAERLGYE